MAAWRSTSPRRTAFLALIVVGACRTGIGYLSATGLRHAGAPPIPAVNSRTHVDTLRVVSFNIEFARRIDDAIGLLMADSILRRTDILLLQEMDAPGTQRIAEALGMWYVYYPAIFDRRARRDFGNAVLSRWPIVDHAKLVLPHPSRYAGTHRHATAAGYARPTREGPATTHFGRWDHIFLKGFDSPAVAAGGTVLDARQISDHRPVWAVGILRPGNRAR